MANNKEFISETRSPSPSPFRGEGYNIYPLLPYASAFDGGRLSHFLFPSLEGRVRYVALLRTVLIKGKTAFLCELCG